MMKLPIADCRMPIEARAGRRSHASRFTLHPPAFTLLEIMVALIQAYVFALLSCIYLNDAIHLH